MKTVFYSLLGGALIVLLSAGDTQAATVSVSSLSTSVAAGNSSWVSKSDKKKRQRSNAKRLRKMRRQRY